MNKELYTNIPFYENDNWSKISFDTQEDFYLYLFPLFKEPGKYNFDETSFLFNSEAQKFRKLKYFSDAPYMSKDFMDYWDFEKEKCRKGVFFKNGEYTWYLPRDYYMWINFLPINDKEQKKFDFPQIRDAQYHIALYEILAELNYEHASIVKKRQVASSYYHCGRLINKLWFEETPILKIGAAEKRHVNEEGDWKFLEEYKNFLNDNTAWYRPMNPGKVGIWQQQIETTINGRKSMKGLKGVLQSLTFDKAPERGIGGPSTEFFYDEGGNAPTADTTYRYLRPAMRSGMITTGLFIIAGSVGELSKAEPLKKFTYYPKANGFYSVKTNLIDEKGTEGETALFIPEQWSMPPYIDKYGNSMVEEALLALNEEFERLKRELSSEDYQLEVSQRPRNLAEAFAYRVESIFPLHLIQAQKKRIEDKLYPCEYLDIEKDENGFIVFKKTFKLPIKEFPITKATEDKEGAICVWERPFKEKPDLARYYYASVDPVLEGRTTTSESLVSIQIYKLDVEVTKYGQESETYIEHGKIVASWCGRFDDINKTHDRLQYMVEMYGAWTLCENNISGFITHMINKKKQHFLVPKSQIMFLKDLGSNENVFAEYGWKNTGSLFRTHLLSQGIEFLKEELDAELTTTGKVVRTTYGIERIPDPMLLKEMEDYQPGKNVDRLVSYCALVAFIKVQQANRGYSKRVEIDESIKLATKELYNIDKSYFKTRQNSSDPLYNVKKSGFRNLK